MKFLNKRQTKKLLNLIKDQYSLKKLNLDYYIHVIKGKFYLISKDIAKINLEDLNIKSVGLYFGTIKQEKFVPSQEAEQMLNL